MLPAENFLIGDENLMNTLKFAILKILLFYTHHRALSCIGMILVAFWCIYTLAILMVGSFWAPPLIVTTLILCISGIVTTIVLSDTKKSWASFAEKVQNAYDASFPDKETK